MHGIVLVILYVCGCYKSMPIGNTRVRVLVLSYQSPIINCVWSGLNEKSYAW